MTKVQGYEIVCSDGHARHYPYFNKGDAVCDAEVFDEGDRCRFDVDTPPEVRAHGPCPGGVHVVREIVFDPPRAS